MRSRRRDRMARELQKSHAALIAGGVVSTGLAWSPRIAPSALAGRDARARGFCIARVLRACMMRGVTRSVGADLGTPMRRLNEICLRKIVTFE